MLQIRGYRGITAIAENHMEKTMERGMETKRIPIIFLLYLGGSKGGMKVGGVKEVSPNTMESTNPPGFIPRFEPPDIFILHSWGPWLGFPLTSPGRRNTPASSP